MAEKEITLMKGNEAIAHAAIRCGCDGYFGYPITPQSEVLETLAAEKPWETTGMVVLQAESEVASINMVYGGAGTGKKVMTSSSSPGISLMCEGLTYLAGSELPCLVVNVMTRLPVPAPPYTMLMEAVSLSACRTTMPVVSQGFSFISVSITSDWGVIG